MALGWRFAVIGVHRLSPASSKGNVKSRAAGNTGSSSSTGDDVTVVGAFSVMHATPISRAPVTKPALPPRRRKAPPPRPTSRPPRSDAAAAAHPPSRPRSIRGMNAANSPKGNSPPTRPRSRGKDETAELVSKGKALLARHASSAVDARV